MDKDYLITDLLEELRNDPSWCEDEKERNDQVNALFSVLLQG